MSRPAMSSRGALGAIARRAMIQRGLLPDFSPAVLAETDAIASAAAETATRKAIQGAVNDVCQTGHARVQTIATPHATNTASSAASTLLIDCPGN